MTDQNVFASGLAAVDPEIDRLIRAETARQQQKLVMIASESLAPHAVQQVLSSCLSHLYAEGYPARRMTEATLPRLAEHAELLAYYRRYGDRRYYKGVEVADFVESLAIRRAAELFANERVGAHGIFANVQPLSGAAANNAVYDALLAPGAPVLGMSLAHGGHLTHGHRVNRSGKHYRVSHYEVGRGGKLDYDAMKEIARERRPKLVIAGFSAYPWDVDWAEMRAVADAVPCGPAYLLADISHTAGLVAAGVASSPIGYADVISMTTHKTLCGPRGAIILSTDPAIAARIDMAVFPGEQGGPHVQQIAAKAVAFGLNNGEGFRQLMRAVAKNAQALGEALVAEGLTLAYGGTNTHMVLVDLRHLRLASGEGVSGEVASRLLDLCHITCNKNTIEGDQSAFDPGAIRLGTVWATQRGLTPAHMARLAKVIARVLTAARSFSYTGGIGEIRRSRLDPGVLEAARAEVQALLADAAGARPAELTGYPYFGYGQEAAAAETLVVYGERAHLLLDHALTTETAFMAPGARRAGYALDANGEVMATVEVARTDDDLFGRRRFLVRVAEGSATALLHWLRALSDGYALVDSDDIQAKPAGPAVVELAQEAFPVGRALLPEVNLAKPYFVGLAALKRAPREFPTVTMGERREQEFVWAAPEKPIQPTCLHGEHVGRAQMAEFAGFKLPVRYSTIREEHQAVRCRAGLFDVTHMGVLEIEGPDAEAFLDWTTTAWLPSVWPGHAKYAFLLAPDGRVIDDVMIYRMAATRFLGGGERRQRVGGRGVVAGGGRGSGYGDPGPRAAGAWLPRSGDDPQLERRGVWRRAAGAAGVAGAGDAQGVGRGGGGPGALPAHRRAQAV
jgi:glycine hydroxymethyltransferase